MAVTETSGNGFALYNGVKLPNIDSVWTDKESYPYAFISFTPASEFIGSSDISGSVAYLTLSANKPFYNENDGVNLSSPWSSAHYLWTDSIDVVNALVSDLGIPIVLNEWYLFQYSSDDSGSGALCLGQAVWSSSTILSNDDNSVYLSASGPIPLDGMTVIEWDGVTDGLENPMENFYNVSTVNPNPPDEGSVVLAVQHYADSSASGAFSSVEDLGDGTMMASFDGVGVAMWASSAFADGTPLFLFGNDTAYVSLFAYTPASTEPEDTTKKDFWNGVACGLCGSGTPNFSDTSPFGVGYITGCKLRALRERKPIAYLYNGVQLPPLPEWDRETYPYVYIAYRELTIGPAYIAYLTKEPLCRKSDGATCSQTGSSFFCCSSNYTPAYDDAWLNDAYETPWGEYKATGGGYPPIWANYNMLSIEDGSVYLSASDPIPVYE